MKTIKKIFKIIWKIVKWGFLVVILLAGISALYNLTLPQHSEEVEILSEMEKAYIAEAMNAQAKAADEVWPGWCRLKPPIIVYNEVNAFLIGCMNPPDGWYTMPAQELRGGEWKKVEDDDFYGLSYYKQPLPDPNITPENFTVKVGDQWVATIKTREYMQVTFFKELRENLPPVVKAVFPYEIYCKLVMGCAETYVSTIIHQAFHSYQGTLVPHRLEEAELAARHTSDYPWENEENTDGWIKETEFLVKAFESRSDEDLKAFAEKFVKAREERRREANLTPAMIDYERKREWLEGLAKYAESMIGIKISGMESYRPIQEMYEDPDFRQYETRLQFLLNQVSDAKKAAVRHGESRFHYSGMLQAIILDRIQPGWKQDIFKDDVYLEDLLRRSNTYQAALISN